MTRYQRDLKPGRLKVGLHASGRTDSQPAPTRHISSVVPLFGCFENLKKRFRAPLTDTDIDVDVDVDIHREIYGNAMNCGFLKMALGLVSKGLGVDIRQVQR